MVAISLFLASLVAFATLQLPSEASPVASESLQRRATSNSIVTPPGYSSAWLVYGKRVSVTASAGLVSLTTIANSASSLTQASVDACTSSCNSLSTCKFAAAMHVSGSSKGDIQCALYSIVKNQSEATITRAPGDGNVISEHGYIRNTATISSSTTLTGSTTSAQSTSMSTRTTSMTSVPSKTMTPPSGGLLVQLPVCSSGAKVPAIANSLFSKGSSASIAYIAQHGSQTGPQDAFEDITPVIGTSSYPVVAPGFYTTSSQQQPNSFYAASINAAWNTVTDWTAGSDAVAPSDVGACSSYEVYDYLLKYLSDNQSKFPNLATVVVAGFSAGGNTISRYSTIADDKNYRFKLRYVIVSPASQAYFSSPRPWLATCSDAFTWPNQWVNSGAPRYVASRLGDAATLFKQWMARDVISSVGTADTSGLDETCGTQSGGGTGRSGRSYAYWAYKNMAAKTGKDVSRYPGYGNLTATGATVPLAAGTTFRHQNCIVQGIAHDATAMYASNCVSQALFLRSEPAGVQPPTSSL